MALFAFCGLVTTGVACLVSYTYGLCHGYEQGDKVAKAELETRQWRGER